MLLPSVRIFGWTSLSLFHFAYILNKWKELMWDLHFSLCCAMCALGYCISVSDTHLILYTVGHPGRLRTNPEGIKNHIKPNGMSHWGGGFKPLIAYVHWKVWVKKKAASEVALVQDMRKVSSDVWRGLCMSHLVCAGGSEDLEAIISLISVGALGGGLVVNLVMSDYGCSWWS